MTQRDHQALEAEYAAMSRKDWDAVLSIAHPDFELKVPSGDLNVETICGVERARRAFEDFFSPFETVSVEPEACFDSNDQIVVFFLQRARPSGSTAFVERRAAHLWTMRDGRAAKLEIFPEREKALSAAGLSEQGLAPTDPH